MSVDAEPIRARLEGEKTKGRSSIEAAGIALWLDDERLRMGVLSEQTRQEAESVILEWLEADVGGRGLEPQSHAIAAKQLARHLSENVDIGVPEPPDLKIETALQEWRRT